MIQENSFEEGKYVYCIINNGNANDFRPIGVEDNEGRVVAFQDVGLVIHSCKAKPYETKSKEKAGEWILAHQYVIDLATEEYGTVIPLTFDTIFKGNDETLGKWLSEQYFQLKKLFARLEGKAEYGIQIFLKNQNLDDLLNENQEIQSLKEKLKKSCRRSLPSGEKARRKNKVEKQLVINKFTKNICVQIENLVDEVKLSSTNKEVPEKWKDKQMILNMSCLAYTGKIKELGNILAKFVNDGFDVRFTGPWPPYSFSGQINESKIKEN